MRRNKEVFIDVFGVDDDYIKKGYQVSNFGRVKNKSGKIIYIHHKHPLKNKSGMPNPKHDYCEVTFYSNGKCKSYPLQRLVYMAFHHVKINKGFDVHHIDGDKTKNTVDNLLLVTKAEHRRLTLIEKRRNKQ